jgi:hypothetical protein
VLVLAELVSLSGATTYTKRPQAAQPSQQPPAPQAPQGRVFSSEAGMIFNQIKPDAAADFEMVMGRVMDALQKSADATRREQARGWKIFKAQEPFQGNLMYVFVMDPAVKGADYSLTKILAEAFPTEVQALYQKLNAAYAAGPSLVNLSPVGAPVQPRGLNESVLDKPAGGR